MVVSRYVVSDTASAALASSRIQFRASLSMLLESSESGALSLHSTRATMALAQHLAVAQTAPRILVLTCGAVGISAGCAGVNASFGGVWGFGRVLRLEHAALRAESVEVSRAATMSASSVFASVDAEVETAWSGVTRHVARLRACGAMARRTAAFVRGAFAISGGLGGRQLGRWPPSSRVVDGGRARPRHGG